MNFLGISLPDFTAKTPLSTPEGAPSRPGFGDLIYVCGLLFVPCALFAFVLNIEPIMGSIGWAGIAVTLVVPFLYRRHYDRIGWYERQEVVLPELPFETRGIGYRIVFGTEGITFSSFLAWKKTIAYSEIATVSLDCAERCLSGVTVSRNVKPYYSATEPPPPQASFHIDDKGDGTGERTRMVMAILRSKVPHATFSGPKWVEEGWVPRTGFSRPSGGTDGSGG